MPIHNSDYLVGPDKDFYVLCSMPEHGGLMARFSASTRARSLSVAADIAASLLF